MEKARKQSLILFLLRYALGCLAGLAAWVVVWWLLLLAVVAGGFLLPANAAEKAADEALEAFRAADVFLPEEVPSQCGYLWVDATGTVVDTSLSGQALKDAELFQSTGQTGRRGRYHNRAQVAGGWVVLQYRIRTEYADRALRWLPAPEIMAFVLLLLGAAAVLGGLTKYAVYGLKHALAPLAQAAAQLQQGRLEQPLPDTEVREFAVVLDAMAALQGTLRDSLNKQWDMENGRVLQMDALAHDLRTPLTVIDGNAQLLQETTLDADQAESVDAILGAAQRATEYVASLRAMAKAARPAVGAAAEKNAKNAAEELKATAEDADAPGNGGEAYGNIAQLLDGLHRDARMLCEVHGLRLIWVQASDAAQSSKWPCADAQELHRAVMNLVQNAVEESPAGSCVTLQCERTRAEADGKAGLLHFTVLDSGAGFSPQALRHGCEPMYTEHTARTAGTHTGFGLTFAADVARRRGGNVQLSNGPGGHGCVVLTCLDQG